MLVEKHTFINNVTLKFAHTSLLLLITVLRVRKKAGNLASTFDTHDADHKMRVFFKEIHYAQTYSVILSA